MTLSEYGHELRHGFIVVLEGSKGEGWKRLAESMREAVNFSSVLGVKDRAPVKVSSSTVGSKGSFVEVLKMVPPCMVVED